jgi:hypothetical protein
VKREGFPLTFGKGAPRVGIRGNVRFFRLSSHGSMRGGESGSMEEGASVHENGSWLRENDSGDIR